MSSNNNNSNNNSLVEIAKNDVAKFPDSDIEVAMEFLGQTLKHSTMPYSSNDRLVKVGRKISSLVRDNADDTNTNNNNHNNMDAGLRLILQQVELIASGKVKVPKVRFGKTNIDMPIVTLGCMRFQQQWGPSITNMNQVGSDCQDNLVEILKTAIRYGINHIETARGYGSSELQLGVALKQLIEIQNVCQRQDLILQTKIPANPDPVAFREALELSFTNLQVDYIDLFAFHGMNFEEQFDWVFNENRGCMKVVKEYVAAGRIKHVGFSTHGSTDFIKKCIETDAFEYVNLHYHYFGSYTASGGGIDGKGNLDNVKLIAQRNMGCFIISPFDKGGRLYAPSKKLRSLTLPDMEPMSFKSFWIWNHDKLHDGLPLHTYTVGAARPSDLDEPAVDAYLQHTRPDAVLTKLQSTMQRLEHAKEVALGKEWVDTWWKGLPKAKDSKHQIEHNQMVWMYNSIKAFGLYEFAKNRYQSFEGNEAKWDDTLSPQENIEKMGKNGWGFVPGRSLQPGVDYSDDLVNVPENNMERVKEAERFVYQWCRTRNEEDKKKQNSSLLRQGQTFFKRIVPSKPNALILESDFREDEQVPDEWETSYDMRPWPDYPDQPARS